MIDLSNSITLRADGDDIPSQRVLLDEHHSLRGSVDVQNRDVYLEFSSRESLYDFAKSLLHEAVYGQGGQKEFYPLIVEGKALVVEGARLTEDSSRIFVTYPNTEN